MSAAKTVKAPERDPLTTREVEVLKLIAEGLTTKEIAARLDIAFKTACTHRASVMTKLDLRSAALLTRYAVRTGLIEA